MTWGNTGWDSVDEAEKESQARGEELGSKVRDAWTPEGKTKRYVILSDQPFGFWAHSLYALTKSRGQAVCIDSNGLKGKHGACPFCELAQEFKDTNGKSGLDMWPSFVGYITVIDCGEVQRNAAGQMRLVGYTKGDGNKKVEYNFDRKLAALKKGGKKKPGLLMRLRDHIEKRDGSLVGYVYDMKRSGKLEETIGTDWDPVERIDVSTVESLRAALKKMKGTLPHHHAMIDKIESNEPFDYSQIFQIETRKQLMRFLKYRNGNAPTPPENDSSFTGDDAQGSFGSMPDAVDAPDDESIPF